MSNGNAPQDNFQEIFLEEASDLQNEIFTQLRALETAPNAEVLAALKRALHTLKGSARMVNQSIISQLAHAMETLCKLLEENPERSELSSLLIQAEEKLNTLLEAIKNKQNLPDMQEFILELEQYTGILQ